MRERERERERDRESALCDSDWSTGQRWLPERREVASGSQQ